MSSSELGVADTRLLFLVEADELHLPTDISSYATSL
jgi:hypothetical protein